MKRIIFWIIDKYTKNITKWRKLFNESQYWSYEQLREFQLDRLAELYNIWSWDEFYKHINLTTKDDLRKFKPYLKGFDKVDLTYHFSSGSTGKPLKTYGPYILQPMKDAIFERAWKSVGWDGKQWILRLTAGEPQWRFYDYWRNVKPMNYRTIDRSYFDWIIKHKPFLIHGGSGAIREITTGIIKMGREDVLKDINVYLMSEDTKEHTKELIKYYKDVYSGYGLAELCTVASQCRHGNYHVNMETCIVEIINGEIVVTDLWNNITPVLRYRTGDYGKIVKLNCNCDRQHQDIIYDIVGRRVDYYAGSLTKRPLSWWVLSPITNRYGKFIDKWKVKVDLKKNKYILYVIWKNKPLKMIWFRDWIKKETGLDLEIKTCKRMPNKNRMVLLEIK
jgi:hypothetical protein